MSIHFVSIKQYWRNWNILSDSSFGSVFTIFSPKMNASATFVSEAYFAEIDYCVFIILLLASMAIGIYFGFFSKSLKTAQDY